MGWLWASIMIGVAGSSLFSHTIRTFRPVEPIHLLSLFTLAAVPLAVAFARRGDVRQHPNTMVQLFLFALVITGSFTLWPGRIMYNVLFGS